MNITEFWALIAKSHKEAFGNTEVQADNLITHFVHAPLQESIDFQLLFESQMNRTYRADLLAMAVFLLGKSVLEEDADEDRFDYFRGWLIAQGEEAVENALKNPDSIANLLEKDEKGECICESETILYIGDIAYEERTGKDNFYDLCEGHSEVEVVLQGKEWRYDMANLKAKFPNVAKFLGV